MKLTALRVPCYVQVKKDFPELTFGEMGKKMGELWKGLSDKEKEKYNKQAAADKVRYDKEIAKYKGK